VLYPDDDFIKELVTKLRNKTNVIDDMASSTKLNRNSSNLEAAKDIRNCVHVIAMNLGMLGNHISRQLDYFLHTHTINMAIAH
jgi:hypothetical protein